MNEINSKIFSFHVEAIEIAEIAKVIHENMQHSEGGCSVYSPALLLISNLLEDYSYRLGVLANGDCYETESAQKDGAA